MHLRLTRQSLKASKPDPEAALLMDRLEQFGRKWEVQSCAGGSTDPGCQLQAAKSLAALVGLMDQHKAVAHRPQIRHVASRTVPWGPLLAALLAPTAHPPAQALAFPATATLVGFMAEVMPLDCCPMLLALLDPPAFERDGPAGQLATGSHAVTCLLRMAPRWRSASMRPYWVATRGSIRLRAHLARCVAAGDGRGGGGGGGGGNSGGGFGYVALAAALRLTVMMVRMAPYVRREVLAQAPRWLPLLLDAHHTAAGESTSPPSPTPGTRPRNAAGLKPDVKSGGPALHAGPRPAPSTADAAALRGGAATDALGLECQAWVLAVLRLLATSRHFWAAVLRPPPTPPPPLTTATVFGRYCIGGNGEHGGVAAAGAGGGGGGVAAGCPSCGVAATLLPRFLSTLSVHLMIEVEVTVCGTTGRCAAAMAAAAPGGQTASGSQPPSRLLPAAAALLCHPGLWRTAPGDNSDSGLEGVDGGDAAVRLVASARSEAVQKVLRSLSKCTPGSLALSLSFLAAAGSSEESVESGMPLLLPVLAAALAPSPTPYGTRAPTWRLPESPLWGKALVPVLALSVRQLLRGAGGASAGTGAAPVGALGEGYHRTAEDKNTAEAIAAALQGADDTVVASTAAVASSWLLLRLLSPYATREQCEQAAQLSVALAALRHQPPAAAATAATATATGTAAVGHTTDTDVEGAAAIAVAAGTAARALLGHFRSFAGAGGDAGAVRHDVCDFSSRLEELSACQRLSRLQVVAAISSCASRTAKTGDSSIGDLVCQTSIFKALAACCLELAAMQSAAPQPQVSAPAPAAASMHDILRRTALHGCLAAMLLQTRGDGGGDLAGSGISAPAVATAAEAAKPGLSSSYEGPALRSLLSLFAAGTVPFSTHPDNHYSGGSCGRRGFVAGYSRGGGIGDGGLVDTDSDATSDSGDEDGGGLSHATAASQHGSTDGATASAQLCRTVSQLVSYEISCTAAALLAVCFGRLGACPAAAAPSYPQASQRLALYGVANSHGTRGSDAELTYGASRTVGGFTNRELLEDFFDAEFIFQSGETSRQAGVDPEGTGGVGAQGSMILATPAALVAAGCPLLAARLTRALVGAATREGEKQAGASAAAAAAAAAAVGMEAAAEVSGGSSLGDGGGRGDGSVPVVGWPRIVRISNGARVPRGAFGAVLDYLVQGEAAVLPPSYSPCRTAAPPPAGQQGGLSDSSPPSLAPILRGRLREVASLASALGLPALRAIARGTPPQPGSIPPPPMPCLQPLLPTQLWIISEPPTPTPSPQYRLRHGQAMSPNTDGSEGGAGISGRHPHPHPHPHLEEQLAAIMRWEEEQDALGRRPNRVRARANAGDDSSGDGDGCSDGVGGGPRDLLRLPAVHIRCLNGSTPASSSGSRGGAFVTAGLAAKPRILHHATGWPADAIIAAPLLRPGAAMPPKRRRTPVVGFSEIASPAQTGYPGEQADDTSSAPGGGCVAIGHGARAVVHGCGGNGSGSDYDRKRDVDTGSVACGPRARTTWGEDGAAAGAGPAGCAGGSGVEHRRRRRRSRAVFDGIGVGSPHTCRTALIPAHRVVLAAGCDYFAALCSDRWEPGSAGGDGSAGGGDGDGGSPDCDGGGNWGSSSPGGSSYYLRPMTASLRATSSADAPPVGRVDPDPEPDLALRVKPLRVPGCDADVVVAVLRYLHSHQFCNYSQWQQLRLAYPEPNTGDTSAAAASAAAAAAAALSVDTVVANPPVAPAVEQTEDGGLLTPLLPLRACEWAPLEPLHPPPGALLPGSAAGAASGRAGRLSHFQPLPAPEPDAASSVSSGGGTNARGSDGGSGADGGGDAEYDGCCGGGYGQRGRIRLQQPAEAGAGQRTQLQQRQKEQGREQEGQCQEKNEEEQRQQRQVQEKEQIKEEEEEEEEEEDYWKACPTCQELRLCFRVFLASNALLLPSLQQLMAQRALHLLRRRRGPWPPPPLPHPPTAPPSRSDRHHHGPQLGGGLEPRGKSDSESLLHSAEVLCGGRPVSLSSSPPAAAATRLAGVGAAGPSGFGSGAGYSGSGVSDVDGDVGVDSGAHPHLHPQPLTAGCLLTAARDAAVLQLPWLVAAAMEELTGRFDSVSVRQTPEWSDLPDSLQRSALEGWTRRAQRLTCTAVLGARGTPAAVTHAAATVAAGSIATAATAAAVRNPSAASRSDMASGSAIRSMPGHEGDVVRQYDDTVMSARPGDAGGLAGAMRMLAVTLAQTA